jgi:hypothetical protein
VAPIVYLKFDEGRGNTANDSSGRGHTGTLNNLTNWVTQGKIGGCVNISNHKAYVSVLDSQHELDNLYSGGMSVAVWIKPATMGASSLGRVVDKQDGSTTRGWIIRTENINTFSFGAAFGTTTLLATAVANSLILSDWNHITITWDGGQLLSGVHLYANGNQVKINTLLSTNGAGARPSDAGIPLSLGNRPSDLARGMAGLLDDFRIYNRVITAAEVASLVRGSVLSPVLTPTPSPTCTRTTS